MSEETCIQIVHTFWAAFDRFEFAAAAPLLHDHFVFELPQSRERVVGRDNFIAFNTHYPGRWRITVKTLVCSGNQVVTECDVGDGSVTVQAISFFTLKDDQIVHIREYWPDVMEAQSWRAQWVERY